MRMTFPQDLETRIHTPYTMRVEEDGGYDADDDNPDEEDDDTDEMADGWAGSDSVQLLLKYLPP